MLDRTGIGSRPRGRERWREEKWVIVDRTETREGWEAVKGREEGGKGGLELRIGYFGLV